MRPQGKGLCQGPPAEHTEAVSVSLSSVMFQVVQVGL